MNHLADAQSGILRAPLSKEEAVAVAKRHFADDAKVVKVEKVDSIHPHHEYRSGELPAYAISFEHASKQRYMWLLNLVRFKNLGMTNGVYLTFMDASHHGLQRQR